MLNNLLKTVLLKKVRLQKEFPKKKLKIGLAILCYERPEYLKVCLDTLFKTKLYNYDLTVLLSDDGSRDPQIKELINKSRPQKYKIFRVFNKKGPGNWGALFNRALRNLLKLGEFDLLCISDSDCIFHPEWLNKTLQTCLWARKHEKKWILGPFSAYNSDDYDFSKILGINKSPYGNYVIKEKMISLNMFLFKSDIQKLGYFIEKNEGESLKFSELKDMSIRYFSTETSYIDHIGKRSFLHRWRDTSLIGAATAVNLIPSNWTIDLEKISPYSYYRYIMRPVTFGTSKTLKSTLPIDISIPVAPKDYQTVQYVIESVRRYLKHPIQNIYLVARNDQEIKEICRKNRCVFVDERPVLPIIKTDIDYTVKGHSRAGWIYQQLLNFSADKFCQSEYIYIINADTVLVQPQVFEFEGKMVFLVSDEYYPAYFKTFKKVFKFEAPAPCSFITHQLFMKKSYLVEMKQEIERIHQLKPWYQVILDSIDKNENSSFADFETYPNWMLKRHRRKMHIEYWYNKRLRPETAGNIRSVLGKDINHFRSASFHIFSK